MFGKKSDFRDFVLWGNLSMYLEDAERHENEKREDENGLRTDEPFEISMTGCLVAVFLIVLTAIIAFFVLY